MFIIIINCLNGFLWNGWYVVVDDDDNDNDESGSINSPEDAYSPG